MTQEITVRKANAIAFDFDGVLFDSEQLNFLATQEAFGFFGASFSEKDYVDYWVLRKDIPEKEMCLEGFLRIKGLEIDGREFRAKRKPAWEKLFSKAKMMPGAKEAVEDFHSQNIPLCIVSQNFAKNIKSSLKRFGISKRFEFVISIEGLKHFKPHPEPYALAAKNFGEKPENVVAIEDNPIGVESAKAAGVKCVAVPNLLTKQCDFSKADSTIKSLEELNRGLMESLWSD